MAQVRIPTPLRKFTGGAEAVEAEGATRRRARAPTSTRAIPASRSASATRRARCAASSTSSSTARTSASSSNLDTPVKDGDEVSIVPAIAGGR